VAPLALVEHPAGEWRLPAVVETASGNKEAGEFLTFTQVVAVGVSDRRHVIAAGRETP